jgi:hypothetical protein
MAQVDNSVIPGEINLNDCSYNKAFYYFEKGNSNENKNEYIGGSKDEYVGYVTDKCKSYNDFECGEPENWMKIGQLKDKNLQLDTTGYGNMQATDYKCNDVGSGCLPKQWQIACRKRDTAFTSIKTDGWADCCRYNNMNGLKANGITCHPRLYNSVVGDNKTRYSDMCRNVCLQSTDSPKVIEDGKETTLKNDYLGDICSDVLQTNSVKSDLDEFCQSEVAYKDGLPVPEYRKICGCHYPESYYEALKSAMEEKFPHVRSILGSRECYSELCQDSKIKENQDYICPDINFLSCIQNQEFNASAVNLEDESQLGMDQSQDCQIIVDGNGSAVPGQNPNDPGAQGNPDGDPDDDPEEPSETNWVMIGLIIGGIVFVLLIISISIGFTRSSGTNKSVAYIQG